MDRERQVISFDDVGIVTFGGVKMETVQRTLEIERIVNLVKAFGWDLEATEAEGSVLKVSFEKKVESPAVEESPA